VKGQVEASLGSPILVVVETQVVHIPFLFCKLHMINEQARMVMLKCQDGSDSELHYSTEESNIGVSGKEKRCSEGASTSLLPTTTSVPQRLAFARRHCHIT
jgi:hypothetical protein